MLPPRPSLVSWATFDIFGGERCRVSIGMDIIHDPIILFLYELTSELESTSAFMVIKVLQRIVHSINIVVMMSEHQPRMSSEPVTHHGGCHCGHVRWEVNAPESVVAWSCNCSNCSMRGSTHFNVPSSSFKLIGESEQFITTYTFGTHTAKHTFCKVCGITSFYVPRSNPDVVAVTFRCVDSGTLSHVEIRHFDGKQLE